MSALIDPQHKLVDIDLAHHRFRVNRDAGRSGEIGAFFNSCTHRGTRICREKRGSAKSFACPYHGWVFNSDGKLVSMNATRGFDADINADGALNLRKAPRLEEYRGFYFTNYNSAAIS